MTRVAIWLLAASCALTALAPAATAGLGVVVVVTSGDARDVTCNDKHRAARC